jgi:outer membrane protein assembly factor BamD
MVRKVLTLVLLTAIALLATGCHRGKVSNPIADINSKQPDKVLYDRAMDAMEHRKYDIARLSLQTLINTYPDSEYIARAKLSVGDSWYAEGGSTALAQAEIEYKDFQTFFPNMPEASEAQLKVANIHYRQMAKPDRDYTHAKRAEDEYKEFLRQYPDAAPKLRDEAKLRLLEVQEVLAEREFRIGRFYFLRESYPAAIARLKSVADNYELYSGSDEALYLTGTSYERLMDNIRANPQISETYKTKLLTEYTRLAAANYDRIVTRYPATDRVPEAKERLAALRQPIPTPTEAAIAQSKAEESSRSEMSMTGKVMGLIRTTPDITRATKVGEPRLEEEKQTSATDLARQTKATLEGKAGQPDTELGLEAGKAGTGAAPESEAPPSSERPVLQNATPQATGNAGAATAELPPQTNEAANEETREQQAEAVGQKADEVDKKTESTSKKKKKKGLRKLIPF